MGEQQKPDKRIVSKSEYAATMGKKIALSSYGVTHLFFCILFTLIAGILWISILLWSGRDDVDGMIVWGVICTLLAIATFKYGTRAIKTSQNTDAGIPFTHANTSALPVTQSLVRASQEPLQAQKAVLLRAAAETSEKQEELLRASIEESSPPCEGEEMAS